MTDNFSRHSARNGRRAVAAIFCVNGFLVGSWAPQIPVLVTRLAISEFTLGLLILVFGAGALVAMPTCGALIGHFGSRAIVRGFSCAAVFGLLGIVAAPTIETTAFALFFTGAVIGGMDVAMNANAVTVERRLGKAIMSSSHGFWSLGGFAGGGLGGLFISAFGYFPHAIVVTLVALVVAVLAMPHLAGGDAGTSGSRGFRPVLPRNPLVYLTGLIALFSMVPEGAVLDWGALYLRTELGADIATAGFAFSFFAGAMAIMRFMGDGVRNRLGAVTTLRLSSLTAAAGMMTAGFASPPWLVIAAFAVCGIGIANMVPIAFSAAGNQPGISSGAGMSVATSIGYSGILLAPSIIGFVAGNIGFAAVFIALSVILFIVFLMAEIVGPADFKPAPAE